MSDPTVTFWVTSTGRPYVLDCVRKTVERCRYPNYRMLIFESQPDNPHGTVETFRALDCEKKVWTGGYPPLGWIYNLFMAESSDYVQRLDDDCWPVCDPADMWRDAIQLLGRAVQGPKPGVVSHVATEMNPRIAWTADGADLPAAVRTDPTLAGAAQSPELGPLLLYHHASGISLMGKRLIPPWNETCHWRQTELYHILLCERMGLKCAYMLRWWGAIGHFGDMACDGISRESQGNLYRRYEALGMVGRRPPETWGTSYAGERLEQEERERAGRTPGRGLGDGGQPGVREDLSACVP